MEQIKNTGACLHPRRSSATPQDGFQRAAFVRLLFLAYWKGRPRNRFYVAAADGRRFLVAAVPEERLSTPTTVVLNWTADLKR